MFGMHADLCQDKWDDKGEPPEDISTMDGYVKYTVFKGTAISSNHMSCYLSTQSGVAVQGQLYGVVDNPIKNVGNCWMNIQEKAKGNIVTGMAIEGDWVEMKEDFLSTFKEKGEEEAVNENENKGEALIEFTLMLNFVEDKWENKGMPPSDDAANLAKLGYHDYRVTRVTMKPDKVAECLISSDRGIQKLTILEGVECNPFKDILNAFLKLKMRGGKHTIIGIIVENEWVEMK